MKQLTAPALGLAARPQTERTSRRRHLGHRGHAPKLLDQHCRAFALGYAEGWALDLPAALLLAAGEDPARA